MVLMGLPCGIWPGSGREHQQGPNIIGDFHDPESVVDFDLIHELLLLLMVFLLGDKFAI